MKHTITYDQLYKIDKDLESIMQKNPGLSFLMDSHIKLFYQVANNHLEKMKEAFDDIREKYVKKNDVGEFMTTTTGGKQEWDFKDSYSHISSARILNRTQVKMQFDKECSQFFSKEIVLPI